MQVAQSSTWPLLWDEPVPNVTPEVARQLINYAPRRNRQMLAALRSARAGGSIRAARRLQRRYLLSFSAKIAAVRDAWASKVASIDPLSDEVAQNIIEAASELFAFKPAQGRARSWHRLKRDGETTRLIHSLTFHQAALDQLAANAGRATSNILQTQFNSKGGGIEKCDAWLAERMPKAERIVTVDIPSCFDVIRRSSVEVSLLLPKPVVEAAMFHPMDHAKRLSGIHTGIEPTDTHDVGTSANKRRVPQGSALAQLAADIEVDKVLRSVAAVHDTVHVAAFGDNLIFVLEDAGWLGSVRDALTSAVTKQFGSDVTTALVHRIEVARPEVFRFCRRTYRRKKGKLIKQLPSGYIDEFEIRAMVALQDAYAAKSSIRLDRCEASINGFLGAHGMVKGVPKVCVRLLVSVNERRALLAKKTVHGP